MFVCRSCARTWANRGRPRKFSSYLRSRLARSTVALQSGTCSATPAGCRANAGRAAVYSTYWNRCRQPPSWSDGWRPTCGAAGCHQPASIRWSPPRWSRRRREAPPRPTLAERAGRHCWRWARRPRDSWRRRARMLYRNCSAVEAAGRRWGATPPEGQKQRWWGRGRIGKKELNNTTYDRL